MQKIQILKIFRVPSMNISEYTFKVGQKLYVFRLLLVEQLLDLLLGPRLAIASFYVYDLLTLAFWKHFFLQTCHEGDLFLTIYSSSLAPSCHEH